MNCKPGDLAVIIGSDIIGNIGRFVNVVRRYEPFDPYFGPEWHCTSVGSPLFAFKGARLQRAKTMDIVSSDADLRPINPAASTLETSADEQRERVA